MMPNVPTSNAKPYFAAMEPDDLAREIDGKREKWDEFMSRSTVYERQRRSLLTLFGFDPDFAGGNTSKVNARGENGQLSTLRPNHYRRTATQMLALTTSQKPALKPRAANTDERSQTQTLLAESILDFYLLERRISRDLKEATWHAITLGAGYVVGGWNAQVGDAVTVDPNTQQPVRNGDLEFRVPMPEDVMFDFTVRSHKDRKWFIVRSYHNKHELAAKYPERADDILAMSMPQDKFRMRQLVLTDALRANETDLIPVLELYHAKTDAVPQGRYAMVLGPKLWLMDTPLPYKRLPVFEVTADRVFGTGFGYTSLFDCLSLQQAVDTQSSIAISNQKTLGVQVLVAKRASGVDIEQISDGFSLIEYDTGSEPPQAISFSHTDPQIFAFREALISEIGLIGGGLTAQTQGTEQRDLSGAAQAMLDAQSLRYNSGLQESYKELCEDVGSFIIDCLKTFATSPRLVQIAGKAGAYAIEEFTGDDLESIDRVMVEVVDPIFNTTAGKMQIADNLLQHNLVNPAQYLGLVKNGNLEEMTEGPEAIRINIKAENEKLATGSQCIVMPTDNHKLHIAEHSAVVANPDVRANPAIYGPVMDHITMHMQVWRETDVGLLAATGQQPPASPMAVSVGGAPLPAEGPMLTAPQPMGGAPGMAPPPMPGQPSGTPPPQQGQPSPSGPSQGGPPNPMQHAPLGNTQPPSMPNAPRNPATGQPWNPMNGGM